MSKPAISVIMACHNAEPFLREAVDSVIHQTFPDWELVVVNDGSTDGSRAILGQYGSKVRVIDQQNSGPYPARNRGVAASRGDLIAFLDADDYWDRTFLEKMYRELASSDAVLAYCGWQLVGRPRGNPAPHVPPDFETTGKLERFLWGAAPWPIHAALVRRQVFEGAGGFDISLPTCMDYDLWLRLGLAGKIARVAEVLAFYRHHDCGQITSKQWRQAENVWRVKKKYLAEHPEAARLLPRAQLRELVDGGLLRRGYDNYWKRDLVSARRIFRRALGTGWWGVKDLKYLLPALLPERLYLWLLDTLDRRHIHIRGSK